jgi:hypothetical protein
VNRYCFVWLLLVLLLSGCGSSATSASDASQTQAPSGASPAASSGTGSVTVEIGYLSHPPVRNALQEVDNLLATYGQQLTITRYDFDTSEGASFAKAKSLTQHTPIAIFVNGSMEFKLGERPVRFYSFPAGEGTLMMSGGDWTLSDLKQVLDQAVGQGS